MTAELNFLDLFLKASIVVQLVIVILISFSIISWAIIIQRSRIFDECVKKKRILLKIVSGLVKI